MVWVWCVCACISVWLEKEEEEGDGDVHPAQYDDDVLVEVWPAHFWERCDGRTFLENRTLVNSKSIMAPLPVRLGLRNIKSLGTSDAKTRM